MDKPMNDETQALFPVTQADRDAAATWFTEYAGKTLEAECMREGTADHWPLVQAFARHRLSTRPSQAEGLLTAALGLQKDLLDRAEWDGEVKVVCAGSGAWRRFCDAIDAAHSGEARSAGEEATKAIIQGLWLDLIEKDDRTSPEEYPDMALIAEDEFAANIRYALAALKGDRHG